MKEVSRGFVRGQLRYGPMAGRVPLAKAIEEGVDPPEELEPDILLRGRVHSIYAASGTGKTWVMLWLITRCLERGEKVVLFDAENGARIVSERLAALGVDTAHLDELLAYFPYPTLTLDEPSVAFYEDLLSEEDPALIVFDSLVNFLGSAGLEENSNDDIVRWATGFTRPARERGIAVLLLDHVPHESSHARGASRKKDEVDVMWSLKRLVEFDRENVGQIALKREKDREGWLPERVAFAAGGTVDGFMFRRSEGTVEEPSPDDGLRECERRALDALRDGFGERGAAATEWLKEAKQPSSTFYRAVEALVRREWVEQRSGRYYPTPGPGCGGRGSTERREDRPEAPESHELPSHSHGSNGSDAGKSPITPTPLMGGSDGTTAGAGGSLANGTSRRLKPTAGQEQRVRELVRQGMSPRWARAEVLGDEEEDGR